MRKNKKAESKLSIVNVVISIVLIIALIPVIVVFSAGTQQCLEDDTPYLQTGYNICSNATSSGTNDTNVSSTNSLSTTERTMLSLVSLFIILAFIFNIVQSSGLIKKK